jgi:hypothetical protein
MCTIYNALSARAPIDTQAKGYLVHSFYKIPRLQTFDKLLNGIGKELISAIAALLF